MPNLLTILNKLHNLLPQTHINTQQQMLTINIIISPVHKYQSDKYIQADILTVYVLFCW